VASVTLDGDRVVRAVFGTRLQVLDDGRGVVELRPRQTLYPRGAVVEATAIPDREQFFARWSGLVSGSNNPVSVSFDRPAPTLAASFSPLPADMHTVAVRVAGGGSYVLEPAQPYYGHGQQVVLTAVPDVGQEFYAWTGDIHSRQTSRVLVVTSSLRLGAGFSGGGFVSMEDTRLTPDGQMEFHLLSDAGAVWELEGATSLGPATTWEPVGTYTNVSGFDVVTFPVRSGDSLRVLRPVLPVE
jgi:hypothetical protein